MFREIGKQIKVAFILVLILTMITGLVYPLTVMLFAQYFFPWQANGSLIKKDDQIIGSSLIGQSFSSNHYFWGRPSATTPYPYNGDLSSGSNLGPSNPALLALIKARVLHVERMHAHQPYQTIPVDLVTASGSGLDPDISPAAAFYQIPRVAKARQISEEELRALVLRHIKGRTLGLLGEPRLNVLQLNLALDNL